MYRDVHDLTPEELSELKGDYYWQLDECGEADEMGISLWNTDDIPDQVIFEHYAGISFVEDDFFCNVH